MRIFWVGGIFLCLALMNCQGPQVCVPGVTQFCACLTSAGQPAQGVQSCARDGRTWGTCRCPNGSVEPTGGEPHHDANVTDGIRPEPRFESHTSPRDAGDKEPVAERFRPPELGPEVSPELTPQQRLKLDLWPWGAQAAVTLSIDDGLKAPFEKLIPEIVQRGWRATLFIATEMATNAKTWALIKQAYLDGHEVTSHTHTHRNMTKLTEKEIRQEFDRAIAELQMRIDPQIPVESFAYPYEASNALVESIVWDYHRYARGGDQGVPVPPNPIPLNDARRPNFKFLQAKAPTRQYTVAQWNSWVDAAVKQQKWLIEEYHGVDGQDWEPRTMADFRAHFDHIQSFGSKLWVAPLSRVGHYIDERQTARFTILTWTPKEIVLTLKDNFKPSHNEPLSYTIAIPASWGWKGIQVTQGGKSMKVASLGGSIFRTESLPEPTLPIQIMPR